MPHKDFHMPPLPPSNFNNDQLLQWLSQQTISFQKVITGSLQAGQEIQSANFVSGSVGWQIDGDGNAEFNDVTVRGTIVGSVFKTDDSGERLEIDGSVGDSFITLFNSSGNEVGIIGYDPTGLGSDVLGIKNASGLGEIKLDSDGVLTLLAGGTSGFGVRVRSDGAGSAPGKIFTVSSDDGLTHYFQVQDRPQVLIPDGTASFPGISFLSDTDIGMFRVSAGIVGIKVVDQLAVRTSGNTNVAAFYDSGGTRMGYVGKGASGSNDMFVNADSTHILLRAPNDNRAKWAGATTTNSGLASWRHNSFGGGNVFDMLPLVSSRKFKKDIRDLTTTRAKAILGLYRPREWHSKAEADPKNVWIPGFVVEESPKTPKDLIAPLVTLVKDLQARIAALEAA